MIEIVKFCKTHGNLTRNDVYEEKCSKGLSFRFRCKQCRFDYEEKNKEKRKEYSREYEKTRRKRDEGYNEWHKERYRKSAREYRRKNADSINYKIREDRKLNPEKYLEYERKNRERNKSRFQELNIIRKHKIDYDEYKWMYERQDGKCEICGKEETKKSRTTGQICRLSIDHDHTSGFIRDLLCHNCNALIGHAGESEKIFDSAKSYIRKHKERNKIYDSLFKKQDGKCQICKEEHKLILDIQKDSENINGLLCHRCRELVRNFNHSSENIRSKMEFLEEFESTPEKTPDGFYIWKKKKNNQGWSTLGDRK